jgi:hypothetical protein
MNGCSEWESPVAVGAPVTLVPGGRVRGRKRWLPGRGSGHTLTWVVPQQGAAGQVLVRTSFPKPIVGSGPSGSPGETAQIRRAPPGAAWRVGWGLWRPAGAGLTMGDAIGENAQAKTLDALAVPVWRPHYDGLTGGDPLAATSCRLDESRRCGLADSGTEPPETHRARADLSGRAAPLKKWLGYTSLSLTLRPVAGYLVPLKSLGPAIAPPPGRQTSSESMGRNARTS